MWRKLSAPEAMDILGISSAGMVPMTHMALRKQPSLSASAPSVTSTADLTRIPWWWPPPGCSPPIREDLLTDRVIWVGKRWKGAHRTMFEFGGL